MINPARIGQARELRGLTQAKLAEALEIEQARVAHFESGRTQPPEDLLGRITLTTGFPPAFFRQPSSADFPMGSLLFRARASVPSRDKTQAYRWAQTVFETFVTISAKLKTRLVAIPRSSDDPATAAQLARAAMGMAPDTPIPHLIHVIEKLGVWVMPLPVQLEGQDAFSLWAAAGERAVIAIFGDAPGDRLRFSVAHEFGHLVLHSILIGNVAEVEDQADRFASELLVPEAAMRAEIAPPVTLTSLAALKPRWRVSIQALIGRSRDLAIISERHYRSLFEQLKQDGLAHA